MLGAAHKPGAIALRPLSLGDMYDGAFRIIRFNPRATVGAAVLVSAVAMVLPLLVTAVLTWTVDASYDFYGESTDPLSEGDALAIVGSMGSLGIGALLQMVGTVLVTGMLAQVTHAAALGRRMSLGEAWASTRGGRWRLIGLAVLQLALVVLGLAVYVVVWVLLALGENVAVLVVWGLVSVPAVLFALLFFWVRVALLSTPALMVERLGVFASLGRAARLSHRQFWRILGVALLTLLLVSIAGQVLGLPLGILGVVADAFVPEQYSLLTLVVVQSLTMVVTAAFVTPFTGAVTSLQYLDQRMRKEAYDVELMRQAGLAG
ncbi:glycerophosphoryl diester phosphodiesterase membrane domain-containing protein [Nocardioides sp. SYSU D00038]|uniref:glycerophosphoryl diester phosphodiesterase membrane domain-containing protein n=1 Tax=Nocardioides sp. SYSU D00038 TaxID=2812554 RepID=UPI0019672FF4|nr:hypothetical protein [Nocardioides sp. SYSU D00038]